MHTQMRLPTRAAPRPPPVDGELTNQKIDGVWGNSSSMQITQKKKPPPRPPPPKFQMKSINNQDKSKKPVRPTELLTNLFGKKVPKQHQHIATNSTGTIDAYSTGRTSSTTFQLQQSKADGNAISLIDLSPPGSPTFTTRSSSDGVSVNSFGSDGNSNPSIFTSSGSTSQTESAFEDDFDFFGSLSRKKKTTSHDPWKVICSQDPFGSSENSENGRNIYQKWSTTSNQHIKEVGESNFFAFHDVNPFASQQQPQVPPSKSSFVMPTIIRPKPRKGAVSKFNNSNSSCFIKSSYSSNNYSGAPKLTFKSNTESAMQLRNAHWDDSENDNSSPPMPSLPPPPPPPEYIAGLEDGLPQNSERPYGVTLYDFPASQPGDLDLKEGDIVYLTKLINDNWMEGRVGNREGMFPVNFVEIITPLPGQPITVVNALYTFKAETEEDLSFEEGASIKVLSRISDDWLYGECEGRKGQFPANFVDRALNDLPNYL